MRNIINEKKSIKFLFFSFIAGYLLLSLRLFYVQIVQSSYLEDVADRQYNVERTLIPKRGRIYDRNMVALASSVNVNSIYAISKQVKDKQELSIELSGILDMPQKSVLEKLKKKKSFVWIKRQVTQQQAEAIEELDNPNVKLLKEPKRFYPSARLASHVIGFVNIDGEGLEGLELLFDRYMRGVSGRQKIQRDAKRRIIPSLESTFQPQLDGHNIILTIDQVIQYIVERELEEVYQKSRAKGATAIVMEAKTGKILAIANRPTYDVNVFYTTKFNQRRNRAITDCYEPGSCFKIITASACLNENAVKPEDKFYCENGEYRYGSRILHDHRPHGWLTFKEVIQVSSNIGVCKLAQKLGEKKLEEYIKKFGFGEKTGIDLPGEVSGIVRPQSTWSRIAITSIPMGQGVAVTPLQMLNAFCVIANGGKLVKPIIVNKVVNNKGEIIKEFKTEIKHRVLSESAASTMREFLVNVVENGTGKRAKINDVIVGGKTGTAQKLEDNGTYSHSKFVASFFGFISDGDRTLAIGVAVDEPKGVYYGGVVAAPVFKKIAESTLNYLKIYESEKKRRKNKSHKSIFRKYF